MTLERLQTQCRPDTLRSGKLVCTLLPKGEPFMNWVRFGIPRRRFPLMVVMLLALLSFAGSASVPCAEPGGLEKPAPRGRKQARAANKNKLPRITYDVTDLVRESSPKLWVLDARAKPGNAGIDILADLMLRTIHPESWRKTKGEASTLQQVNGTKLEIRTSPAQHAEIADLLAALRRQADIMVVVGSELYEVERKFYEKQIRPGPADRSARSSRRLASIIEGAVVKKLRKHAVRLRSHKVTLGNERQGAFFSLRKAVVYQAQPRGARNPEDFYQTAFHGMTSKRKWRFPRIAGSCAWSWCSR
jgi:hypothetical protein